MHLEDLQMAVRPRNPWEAMDLGVAMVRRWWRSILVPWIVVVWTLAGALAVLLPAEYLWSATLIIWYLKPLYDRLVLFVLSRALFGDTPSPEQTLRAFPQWAFTGLLHALTIGRLEPARSFNLPVWELEGLRGRERRTRLTILNSRARSHAVGFTLVWLHLEVLILISLYGVITLMIPPEVDIDLFTAFVEQQAPWHHYLAIGLYVLALTIMEPIYAAGGFGLYLNRRTELEGWDIELAFRRLATREPGTEPAQTPARALAIAGSLALLLTLMNSGHALAGDSKPDYKALIQEVLADEAFSDHETVEVWLPKDRDAEEQQDVEEDSEPTWLVTLGQILAHVAELLLWLAVALLLLLLYLRRDRLLAAWRGQSRSSTGKTPPQTLFGLDVTPESLPDDVPATAWGYWQAGNQRKALSLLYRGTVATLVQKHNVEIPESATEGELLRDCRARLDPSHFELLVRLTNAWQRLAYAHRSPAAAEVEGLCREWPAHFGPSTKEAMP
jgi:hypothetical protein